MTSATDHAMPPGTATGIIVTGLYRYPIKSCAGTAVESVAVNARGVSHDRELMLVDARSGLFLTQRELPRMALIRPVIAEDVLRVEAPGVSPLRLPLLRRGDARDVVIWRDRCRAVDQGDEAAAWFGSFLGVECRLVRMAEDFRRRVDPAYETGPGDQVGFADGFPFLLISVESLADLNGRLPQPLPINRFRPNIVVRGSGVPFAEDGWRHISIGGIDFAVVKPCARCAITTTDQETAVVGKEPLATLAQFRRGERGVFFGQNLIHMGTGALHVGDAVRVLETGSVPR